MVGCSRFWGGLGGWAAAGLAVACSGPLLAQSAISQLRISNPLIHASVVETTEIKRISYRGWPEAWALSNGSVEAIVVPAVGRVMQFRFIGSEGPFWENRPLAGRAANPAAANWENFGGDKAWPAPQKDWIQITSRAWPPPGGFDATPAEATVTANLILLTWPVDPAYGIRMRRRIELVPRASVMNITTTYQKVQGDPVKVGVWIITQLADPVNIFVPVAKETRFPAGFSRLAEQVPASLRRVGDLLELQRDPSFSYKIGSDADSLLWVGDSCVLRIDCPRVKPGEYPDQGSSMEVYSNPGDAAYVELETLSPLRTLRRGEEISSVNTYTLFHRDEPEARRQAAKILSP